MPERIGAPLFLLARFAEFFEAVARSKLAIAEGRLGALLVVGDEPVPADAGELAVRLSAQLASVLLAQEKEVARSGTHADCVAHREAMYVMAALTDEIFILELDWAGCDAWMDALLEYKLFRSRNAGVRLFEMAEALLEPHGPDPTRADLAAVMVMALQLGFKGRYRGAHGDDALRALRNRLFRLAEREYGPCAMEKAFPQALQQLQAGGTPQRLAPLTPWYTGAIVFLVAYLVISSVMWLILIEPFRSTVGKG